jgi:hypothetical protein
MKDELPVNNLLKIIPIKRKIRNTTNDQENTESAGLSFIFFFIIFRQKFINKYANENIRTMSIERTKNNKKGLFMNE